jgi:hypothetical protein
MVDVSVRKAFLHRILTNQSLDDIYSDERRRLWEGFAPDEQKEIRESRSFVGFARASGLPIDAMGHTNEKPPLPDISSTVDGQPHYFELGEITDEGLARRVSISERTGELTGGPFSQSEPLLKMFREKCGKAYPTNGVPVDLVLYYSRQYPHEGALLEYLKIHTTEISSLIASSPYKRVWIYSDWPPQKILWNTGRTP